jgi:thioredoxin reductase (NADPH)
VSPVRPEVTVVGRRHEPEHHRLRDYLTRTAQPFRWLEAGSPEADLAITERGVADADLPVLIDGEDVHVGVTVERLAAAWLQQVAPSREEYDLAIIGAGPAGLAAAVYAASDGLSTLVLERDVPGGQASHTSMIENFFGFPEGIGGAELARLAGRQAEGFGAELLVMRGLEGARRVDDGRFRMEIAGGYTALAAAIIVAPGVVWRQLEIDGLDALLGRGVYYGAGRSEASQCGGDDVVVVGAGNSAGQAVMHLGNAGARVKMLVRGDSLAKSMSAYLVTRIEAHPLIDVRLHTQIAGVESGADGLTGVMAEHDGSVERLAAQALFLCIGGAPRTGWATDAGVTLDRAGFVSTGPDLLDAGARPAGWPLDRDPLPLETNVPGLFAAGDVRSGSTKRVAAAVGEGSMAVALVHRYLDERLAVVP